MREGSEKVVGWGGEWAIHLALEEGTFWISVEEGRTFLQLSPRIGTHPKTSTVSSAPVDNCEIVRSLLLLPLLLFLWLLLFFVCLASSPAVLSLATRVCEPATYITPAPGSTPVSVECVIQGKFKSILPCCQWAREARAATSHTSCQHRPPTSRKREWSQHMRSSNEQIWEMNGERIQETKSPWCVVFPQSWAYPSKHQQLPFLLKLELGLCHLNENRS